MVGRCRCFVFVFVFIFVVLFCCFAFLFSSSVLLCVLFDRSLECSISAVPASPFLSSCALAVARGRSWPTSMLDLWVGVGVGVSQLSSQRTRTRMRMWMPRQRSGRRRTRRRGGRERSHDILAFCFPSFFSALFCSVGVGPVVYGKYVRGALRSHELQLLGYPKRWRTQDGRPTL